MRPRRRTPRPTGTRCSTRRVCRWPSSREAVPRWVPLAYSDERKAWDGRLPEHPDVPIRVEASAFAGRPVFFVVTGSWDRSSRGPQAAVSRFTESMAALAGFVMPAMMLVGVVLARRQMRLKRGDRVGAFRAATITFIISLTAWILSASHVPSFGARVEPDFRRCGEGAVRGGAALADLPRRRAVRAPPVA